MIQNYLGYPGVRLNNEAFSAYPCEGEILLREGVLVYILDFDQVEINNRHKSFAQYTGKTVTVIYMANLR